MYWICANYSPVPNFKKAGDEGGMFRKNVTTTSTLLRLSDWTENDSGN